jgi:hypothetical protein
MASAGERTCPRGDSVLSFLSLRELVLLGLVLEDLILRGLVLEALVLFTTSSAPRSS